MKTEPEFLTDTSDTPSHLLRYRGDKCVFWKSISHKRQHHNAGPASITSAGLYKYYLHGEHVTMSVFAKSLGLKVGHKDTIHRNDIGELHNLAGPALVTKLGHESYWIDGVYYSKAAWEAKVGQMTPQPHISGSNCVYWKNKEGYHRTDGPAYMSPTGYYVYYFGGYAPTVERLEEKFGKAQDPVRRKDTDGKLHCYCGPALITEFDHHEYWIHGQYYPTREDWAKAVGAQITKDEKVKGVVKKVPDTPPELKYTYDDNTLKVTGSDGSNFQVELGSANIPYPYSDGWMHKGDPDNFREDLVAPEYTEAKTDKIANAGTPYTGKTFHHMGTTTNRWVTMEGPIHNTTFYSKLKERTTMLNIKSRVKSAAKYVLRSPFKVFNYFITRQLRTITKPSEIAFRWAVFTAVAASVLGGGTYTALNYDTVSARVADAIPTVSIDWD